MIKNIFYEQSTKNENFISCKKKRLFVLTRNVILCFVQKPHGIMPLLDEESHFPQSSDYTLVHKLKKYCSNNRRFLPELGDKVSFGIKHYAEDVSIDLNENVRRALSNNHFKLRTLLANL